MSGIPSSHRGPFLGGIKIGRKYISAKVGTGKDVKKRSIFVCYCQEDIAYKELLLGQFGSAGGDIALSLWHDGNIPVGGVWFDQIVSAIDESFGAIVLVSPGLLMSEFVQTEELPRILQRMEEAGNPIFPILIRHCFWQHHGWLKSLQMEASSRPISEFRGRPAKEKALNAFAARVIQASSKHVHNNKGYQY